MFFIVAKVVLFLLLPPASLLILMAAGFLIVKNHRGCGKLFISTGFLLLYLLSIGPVSSALIRPLETAAKSSRDGSGKVDAIVVLGGGVKDLAWLGLMPEPSEDSLARMVAGLRQYRALHIPIVFTGGSGDPAKPNLVEAEAMGRVAADLGFSGADILFETRSRNTAGNAQAVKSMIQGQRIMLVTSAYHMRRASALFRVQGFKVVPVPTGYVSDQHPFTSYDLIPHAGSLSVSSTALYEYLSLAWYGIKGDL